MVCQFQSGLRSEAVVVWGVRNGMARGCPRGTVPAPVPQYLPLCCCPGAPHPTAAPVHSPVRTASGPIASREGSGGPHGHAPHGGWAH